MKIIKNIAIMDYSKGEIDIYENVEVKGDSSIYEFLSEKGYNENTVEFMVLEKDEIKINKKEV